MMKKYICDICPNKQAELEHRKVNSRNYFPTSAGHMNYEVMKKYRGDICPNKQAELEHRKVDSMNRFPTPASHMKYEMDYYSTQYVVI